MRSTHVVVYIVTTADTNGIATAPIGSARRFDRAYELAIQTRHQPEGACLIRETLDGVSVVFFWTHGRIDAVCVRSREDAGWLPGYTAISPEDLAIMDAHLLHFPRKLSAASLH